MHFTYPRNDPSMKSPKQPPYRREFHRRYGILGLTAATKFVYMDNALIVPPDLCLSGDGRQFPPTSLLTF